jgi:hypothetical protein
VIVRAFDTTLPVITLDGHTEVVISGLMLRRGAAGVFLTNASQLMITHSKLSGNRVGIDSRDSSVTVTESIIASNGGGRGRLEYRHDGPQSHYGFGQLFDPMLPFS